MKSKLILFLCAILLLLTTECDKNENNIEISQYSYINNSDHWDISTYNGYQCTEYEIIENEDGSISVTMNFNKLGVEVNNDTR